MSEIEIRQAPIALKDRITALCRDTYEKHRNEQPYVWSANFFEVAIQPHLDAAFTDKKGQQLGESPSLFVAMIDDQFVGYLRISEWSVGIGGELHSGSVEDICVIPNYQGRGVARALIAHAKVLADRHDWDNLGAQVAEWNAASKGLFESAGFTVQNRTYRFGPKRQARDIPVPPQTRLISLLGWFCMALTILSLAAIGFLLTK
ncbi:MAG: GNAT family N-acetyltransferase [Boseongicola sp.]